MTTPDERARELLVRMTLEEKAQQLTAIMPMGLMGVGGPTSEQLENELSVGIGQVSMYSMFNHLFPAELARVVNTVQRHLVENTRLGIPALFHLEALNGLVAAGFTTFPTGIALASTWNPGGVEEMAGILSRQMRSIGHGQALSPVMDVARDARWGRVHESYGEDPCLVSEMSVAFTRGMQGSDLSRGVIATGKHFLGFGMTDGGQHMAATGIGGRELREVYARPFETAIREAGLASVMNSYSSVDGIPVGASSSILNGLLREDLSFTGTVVSDYGTIAHLFDRHGVATSLKDAGRIALEAGLDVELPDAKGYGPTLVEAVREGLVAESLVDRSVLRVLRDKFALGLFDDPYVDEDAERLDSIAHEGTDLALTLAQQSVTLLRNDDNILPLAKSTTRIAVIGPHADVVATSFPGYTYFAALAMFGGAIAGEKTNMAGAEEAEEAAAGTMGDVLSSQFGSHLDQGLDEYARKVYGARSMVEAVRAVAPDVEVVSIAGTGVLDSEPFDIDAAVAAAEGADVVVLALGGRPGWFGAAMTEGEGSDRANIDLPSIQVDLARAVAATGTRAVGIVFTGRPFALTDLESVVPTLLHVPYGGQSGMTAVAQVLFGDVDPGGRLPLSLPRHSGQVPVHHGQHLGSGYRRTEADAHKGYTDMSSRPLHPFGHGLSYTAFDYSELQLADTEISTDGTVKVALTVTNVGTRLGSDVVQFYASHRARLVTRPAQELVAFARVSLEPGESVRIDVAFSTGQLAYLGLDSTFMFEAGDIDLMVGASSDDIRQRATVTTNGPTADWSHERPLLATVEVTHRPGPLP